MSGSRKVEIDHLLNSDSDSEDSGTWSGLNDRKLLDALLDEDSDSQSDVSSIHSDAKETWRNTLMEEFDDESGVEKKTPALLGDGKEQKKSDTNDANIGSDIYEVANVKRRGSQNKNRRKSSESSKRLSVKSTAQLSKLFGVEDIVVDKKNKEDGIHGSNFKSMMFLDVQPDLHDNLSYMRDALLVADKYEQRYMNSGNARIRTPLQNLINNQKTRSYSTTSIDDTSNNNNDSAKPKEEDKEEGKKDAFEKDIKGESTEAPTTRDRSSSVLTNRIDYTDLGSVSIKSSDITPITSQLARNSLYKQHGPGSATAIYVNDKTIFIGTFNGCILQFNHAFEMKQTLGGKESEENDRDPVTVLHVTVDGDTLASGYASGRICIWSLSKGTVIHKLKQLHTCKITYLHIYRDPETIDLSASSRFTTKSARVELTTISADSDGKAFYGRYSKSFFSNLTADFDCLLNGNAGSIINTCLSSNLRQWSCITGMDTKYHNITNRQNHNENAILMSKMEFLAFNTTVKTFVVMISPLVNVLQRWMLPSVTPQPNIDGSKGNNVSCLCWSWTQFQDDFEVTEHEQDSSKEVASLDGDKDKRITFCPMLVRAFNDYVEIMRIFYDPPDPNCGHKQESVKPVRPPNEEKERLINNDYYKCEVICARNFNDDKLHILKINVIDMDRLSFLTRTHLHIVDHELNFLEKYELSASVGKSVLESVTLGINGDAGLFSINQIIYVLCSESLTKVHIHSWPEKVDEWIKQGEWMKALALAVESWKVEEKKLGDSVSIEYIKHSRSMLQHYIVQYVEIGVAECSKSKIGDDVEFVNEHIIAIMSTCFDYCFFINLIEGIYGKTFELLVVLGHLLPYFEALEPYILNKTITILPQRVLKLFVETMEKYNRVSSLDRCISRLQVHDEKQFDKVCSVVLRLDLITAFINQYCYFEQDYLTAFQILFENFVFADQINRPDTINNALSITQLELGYKTCLFLKSCAEEKKYPLKEEYASSLSTQALLSVLILLTSEVKVHITDEVVDRFPRIFAHVFRVQLDSGTRTGVSYPDGPFAYPYLQFLLRIDGLAVIRSIANALNTLEKRNAADVKRSTDTSNGGEGIEVEDISMDIMDVHASLLLYFSARDDVEDIKKLYLDLCSESLCRSSIVIPWEILCEVVEHMHRQDGLSRFIKEELILSLVLKSTQQSDFSHSDKLMVLLRDNHFYRALMKVKQKVHFSDSSHIFDSALAYYVHPGALRKEYEKYEASKQKLQDFVISCVNQLPTNDFEKGQLCDIICRHMLGYAQIDIDNARYLVQLYLMNSIPAIVKHTSVDSNLQLQLLDVVVKADDNKKQGTKSKNGIVHSSLLSTTAEESEESTDDVSNRNNHNGKDGNEKGSSTSSYMSAEDIINYVELLAKSEPQKVYGFLEDRELNDYQRILKVCDRIPDAKALIVERMGDRKTAFDVLAKHLSNLLSEMLFAVKEEKHFSLAEAKKALASSDKLDLTKLMATAGVYGTFLHALKCLLQTCCRDAPNTALWFSAQEMLLLEWDKLRGGSTLPSIDFQVMYRVIKNVLEYFLHEMCMYVSPSQVVSHIQLQSEPSNNGNNGNCDVLATYVLLEFRDILDAIMQNSKIDTQMMKQTRDIAERDLFKAHDRRLKNCKRGRRMVVTSAQLMEMRESQRKMDEDENKSRQQIKIMAQRGKSGRAVKQLKEAMRQASKLVAIKSSENET